MGIHLMVYMMVNNKLNWLCPDRTSQFSQIVDEFNPHRFHLYETNRKWVYICAEFIIVLTTEWLLAKCTMGFRIWLIFKLVT